MLDAGLPWLPVVAAEQCSDVYFFLGTRALKVAVFRLEVGLGLLLALGVLLLLQLLTDRSSEDDNNFPKSTTSDSPSEVSLALIGST